MSKSTVLILLLGLVLSSCKKDPVASYSVEVINCDSPYQVKFTNLSQHFSSYRWEINGQSYENYDPTVELEHGTWVETKLLLENGRKTTVSSHNFYPENYYFLPNASFKHRHDNCENFKSIFFTNESTGNIDGYYWEFGDGQTSTQKNPWHGYPAAGQYNVSLSVIRCSDTVVRTKTINVVPENVLPKAKFSLQKYGSNPSGNKILAGNNVKFVNKSSFATSYHWDFGDGRTSTSTSPKISYSNTGTYTVTLTASCNGNSSVKSIELTVKEPSMVTVTGITLNKFPESTDGEKWDFVKDEEVSESDLKPDIYIKVYKGTCVLLTTSTKKNVADSDRPSWTANRTLESLSYEYSFVVFDEDSGSDDEMGEVEIQPDEHFTIGNYPSSIEIEEGDVEIEISVCWK